MLHFIVPFVLKSIYYNEQAIFFAGKKYVTQLLHKDVVNTGFEKLCQKFDFDTSV